NLLGWSSGASASLLAAVRTNRRANAGARLGPESRCAALVETRESRVDARGERPFEHRTLAERRELHARCGKGQPLGQAPPDRVEQILVGTNAASEDDEGDVERRR